MKKKIVSIIAAVIITGSSLHAFPSPGKGQLATAITAGLVTSYGLLYYNKYKSYCKAVQEAEDYIESSQGQDAFDFINDQAVVQNERAMQKWGMDRWTTAEAIRGNKQNVAQALAQDVGNLNPCRCYGLFTYKKLINALEVEQKNIESLRERLQSFYYVNPQPQGEGWLQSAKSTLLKIVRRDLSVPQQRRAAQLAGQLYQLELRLQALKDISQEAERGLYTQGQSFLRGLIQNAPGARPCNSPYCCNQ